MDYAVAQKMDQADYLTFAHCHPCDGANSGECAARDRWIGV
jgi:hypothetical protein